MSTTKRLALAWLAMLAALPLPAQGGFYLKDGDRVVFYGDSITDQRLYTTYTETFVLTRFPERRIDFVHSGWGGDRVGGGGGGPIETRLHRDVISYRPTVVTVMLGMNDGRYRAFDPEVFNTYAAGYETLVQMLKVTGLSAPKYTLKIDGEEAAVLAREALASGVNLALLPTPMARQAASVHSLTLKHNSVHFLRWRQVQLPLEGDTLVQKPVVLGALDSLEMELVQQQRAAALPKARRFELTP